MRIEIPGCPVTQLRMRHSNFGGFVKVYDPKAKEKKAIRDYLEGKKTLLSFEYPRISFLFQMPMPKSLNKKQQAEYSTGRLKHVVKPDVDNLIKLYLDCLDGIIIHHDQRVSLGSAIKVYHPEPKTIIWINETKQLVEAKELDCAFLHDEKFAMLSSSEKDSLLDFYNL